MAVVAMAVVKLHLLRRLCELNVVRQVFNVWCACASSRKQGLLQHSSLPVMGL